MKGATRGVRLLVMTVAAVTVLSALPVPTEITDVVLKPVLLGATAVAAFLVVRDTRCSAWLAWPLMTLLATLIWLAADLVTAALEIGTELPLHGDLRSVASFGVVSNVLLGGFGAGLGAWARRRSRRVAPRQGQ